MPTPAHMFITLCAAATTQHYEYTSLSVRHHSHPGLVEPSLFRALRHQQRAQKVLAAAKALMADKSNKLQQARTRERNYAIEAAGALKRQPTATELERGTVIFDTISKAGTDWREGEVRSRLGPQQQAVTV